MPPESPSDSAAGNDSSADATAVPSSAIAPAKNGADGAAFREAGSDGDPATARDRADARALSREIELAGAGPAAARLSLALADLVESRLGDLDGAFRALERARMADPESPAVLAAVRRAALRTWRWPLAADVLREERRILSGNGPRGAEFVERSLELAGILADRLNRAEEALPILLEVLDTDPSNPSALSRAVPMWTAASAWSEEAEHLAAAAEACLAPENGAGAAADIRDPRRAAALLYEAAEIHRWRLKAPEQGARMLARALSIDPLLGAAAKALAEVASELADHMLLATALEREAALAARPELAAAALVKLAATREELFGDAAGAEGFYRAALEKEPRNRLALLALSRLAEARGDHALHAELLERRLLLATEVREAIAISLALGSLYEERLGSKDRAANHFQRVLSVTADEAPAFRALGRLMASTQDWRGLIALYEREAAETPDLTHKVHCLFKIAELYEEQLGEDGSAIASYKRVLEAHATYLPALRALGRLFQRAEDFPALVDLYRNEAMATSDTEQAVSLLERVADIQEEKLGDLDGAAATWQIVLQKLPNHLPALRSLGRIYYRREVWAKLVEVNLLEASLTKDPRVVASLLQKTGEIYEEKLSLPEDALRCYREALDHVPAYLPAMRSLGRLAASRGAWEEVVKTEEMEAEGTADPRRAASLLASAAEHYETKLNDPQRAIKAYEKVLTHSPAYLPAIAGLSRLYRKAGKWEDLVRILESAIPAMDRDPGAAAALLLEIASVEGHRLKSDSAAMIRIAAARAGQPSDLGARREHEEYLARAGSWMELAGVYAANAESDAPGAFRAALYVRLGDLAQEVAGAEDGGAQTAAGFYRAALSLEPANRAAAAGLDELGRRTQNDRLRIEGLSAISMCAGSLIERRSVLVELAGLYDAAGDATSSSACWTAASEIRADADALESQARRARAANAGAAAQLYSQASGLSTGVERERLAIEASLAFADAGDFARAAQSLDPFVVGEGETTPALLALDRIQTSRAQAPGVSPETALEAFALLVDARKKLAAKTRDAARRTELLLSAAEILIQKLTRPQEATELLEQISSTETAGSGAHTVALTLLRQLHSTTGDAASEAGVLERQAESANGEQKAALLSEAARILRPADPDRAILLWERAAAANPGAAMPILRSLIETYYARENWQPLLTTWNRVISATRDPSVAADAFFQKGLILADKLSLADKAEQHYQRALGADPAHRPALERLAALQESTGRAAEARATWKKLGASLAEDDPAWERVQLTLARLDEAAGEDAAALATLTALVAKLPRRSDLHQRIVALHAKKGDTTAQAAALRGALAAAPESEEMPLRMKLAVVLESAGDDAGAMLEYRAVIKAEPGNSVARAGFAALLAKKPANRAEALAAHGAVLKLDPVAIDSLLFLARTFEETKAHDKVLSLLAVLCWTGKANDEQQIFYKDQVARAPRKGTTPLSADDRRALLVHPDGRSATGDLVQMLGSGLYAGLPFDAPPGSQKIAGGDKHPLRAKLDNLKSIFDGADIDLYISREPGVEARVVPCDPMVIVVGMGFAALPSGVQDFLLARAVFRAITGFPPAGRTEHEVRADLWTAAAALDFTDPPMGSDPKRIKAIAKAVTRKQRKDVSEPLQAWVSRPQSFDVGVFVTAAKRSADRAGLLACVEVDRAVEALSFVEPEIAAAKADESNVEAFWIRAAKVPVLHDLLVFAVSEELFTLRRKTGLSIL